MKRPLPAKGASKTKRPAEQSMTVEPLLPVPIPHTTARLARGMRAGRWVFATGQSGTDYVSGLAPEVVQADRPLNGESHSKREARRIYRNVGEVLAEVGANFSDVVRVDQYYTTVRALHPYHEVRREVFKGVIPPSTSNLHQRFSRTDQTIEIQVIAAVPGSGLTVKHETFTPSYNISPVSGYSPALSVGDFRFVPGQTAEAREGPAQLDPEARSARTMWREWPIKLETDFIIKRKLKASLEGAGASLDTVVKAQVYLSDRDDVPAFNEVWLSHFKKSAGDHDHRDDIAGFRHLGSADRDQHDFARNEGQDEAGGNPRPRTAAVRRLGFRGEVRRSPVPVGADGARRRTVDRGSARRSASAVLWHSRQGRTAFHHPPG